MQIKLAKPIQPNRTTFGATLAALLALAIPPSYANAQASPTTADSTTAPALVNGITTQPNGGLTLNFKEADINAVLDELSSNAGLIIDRETKVEGKVSLEARTPIKITDAVAALNTVLKSAGYVAILQGNILKVVAKDKANRQSIPVHVGSNPDLIPQTDELITQVIPLKYADATQLKTDLQPVVNPDAVFTANASANALVVTDTSANVRRLVEIVGALDTSLADAAEVRVFNLEFADATSVATLVNSVFGDTTQGTGNQNRGNQNPFQALIRQRFGPGGGGGGPDAGGDTGEAAQSPRLKAHFNATADSRTNAVVVTGSADAIATVATVIKELDANPASNEEVLVVHLKNAQAPNVAAVMNSLFNGVAPVSGTTSTQRQLSSNTSSTSSNPFGSSGSSSPFGSSGSSSFGGGSTSANPFTAQTPSNNNNNGNRTAQTGGVSQNSLRTASELAGQVTIIADDDTNSILLRSAPKNFDAVKAVIAELDRPVPQVLIKVLIAEVTHDNDADLGAEFSILNLRAAGLGQKYGTNFSVAAQTGGLVTQILESNFTATIHALETVGKLDVLSRPYILASDNQLASITVGQEVPFITSSRETDTGETINTIQYSDIGILLNVIPHVNPDGMVVMDVAPEISAISAASVPISSTVNAPVFDKRSAQTRVAILDGQTVVIGGLMEDQNTETIDKVPVLGDIPLIGLIFQRHTTAKTKTELLIFLSPRIALQPETLRNLSQQEIDSAKNLPKAVDPGTFQQYKENMNSAPGSTLPSTLPNEN